MFSRFFRPTTVDGVVSKFDRAVDDLEAIRTAAVARTDAVNEKIRELQFKRNDADREARRAERVAARIKELIG